MKILDKIFCLVLFIIGFNANALDIDYSLIGKPAPTFELAALYEKQDGKLIRLTDYKGKLVLINFWASWCGPCRAEIPTLNKIQETYNKRSFTVIGLAVEGKEDADKFLEGKEINYPLAYDREESLNTLNDLLVKFGNPDKILPFSVLIGPRQNILSIYPGIISEAKLQRVLGRLLDDF